MKNTDPLKFQQPPISDYGYISDCHSSALISKSGSIDWCCMPRIDSPSCFGRIIDWKKGGYCQILPVENFKITRQYLDGTMVLLSKFITNKGEAKIYDFFPMKRGGIFKPYQQILRIIEGVKNEVEMIVDIVPRFDYGSIKPWIKPYKRTSFSILGGSQGLLISSNIDLQLKNPHRLIATLTTKPSTRFYLSILFGNPEELDNLYIEVPSIDELDFRLEETKLWWQTWSQKGKYQGPYAKLLKRSALVLKSLSNAQTGAIAAAATTSLPEELGGIRNWDYRYSWIRDSYFSVHSLIHLGFVKEADNFRRFIERSSHSDPKGLQTLFGVYGEKRLQEYCLELEGYCGSKPVRIGNFAAKQLQLCMYGLLLDLAWDWHVLGSSPDNEYWLFLKKTVNLVLKIWQHPDSSIWEMRGAPRHFVYSKMLCWVALDRSIKMARDLNKKVPIIKWENERDKVRREIEEKGYNKKEGVFIQAFDFNVMDSSLLLLPLFGFIDYNDKRMVRTVNKIIEELEIAGLLLRYPRNNDQLPGDEGVFLASTFWLVNCLAMQGQKKEAKKYFNNAIATCNDLGLFSEEYNIHSKIMLGNFPQGFTHLSLILAAMALASQ